jgi:iron-sulfur cluster repair protein YtfE (RIC family)
MCGHCGCQGVDAIGELRDEHLSLQERAHAVRQALGAGDRQTAHELLVPMVADLVQHVTREEQGVFTALRQQGDFVEEVAALEAEHVALDAAIASLDPSRDDFDQVVKQLLEDLEDHIEREDLGIFPVSVVTLGATGWATVERAHADHPTFLPKGNPS